MRVLLVEDNERMAEVASLGLRRHGFVVDVVGTLEGATTAVTIAEYSAFVVDRMLPDGDGADWIHFYRKSGGYTPAIILTASGQSVADRVFGLNGGADDYVIKPVHIDELAARVRAVMRRPTGALGVQLVAGNISFDASTREVVVAGNAITISRREVCLLEILMRRVGRVVAKSAIEQDLYNFDKEVTPNAIETSVSRLRGHLAAANATAIIQTVRGVGYMLQEKPS